ncbi:MAG: DNA alkylation repair protein [Lentisphaeria bacterium]|nr:DNA alkylation repair protein [Lentisphaeria bacterium]
METVRRQLEAMAEPGYRAFAEKIVKGGSPILGVRSAGLQKLLKELLAGDWRAFLEEDTVGRTYEELVILAGVLAVAPMPLAERLQRLRGFVPMIDSWAVCDSLCGRLRFDVAEAEAGWDFLATYLGHEDEFAVRFGVVGLMSAFMDEARVSRLLAAWDGVRHPGYYARMAVAWAVSIAYVNFPAKVEPYLSDNGLDKWTYNKALQKIIESRQVTAATRAAMRGRKRR